MGIKSEFQKEHTELVIKRTFDVPRELLYAAWTSREHLEQWWGPKGFEMHVIRYDLRSDGIFLYKQRSPEGMEMWGKFQFQEIDAPKKLVFVSSFSNSVGQTVRAPFSASWPLEIQNTLTFLEQDSTTNLIIRGTPLNGTEEENQTFETAKEQIKQGFNGTLDQLESYLDDIL
ncbi:SRPBCC family protein [Pseudalkalibacillus hwajinpoensis]|uniref:SRPBCC family protein n=1 Tax=Guptibacillus hwajinpoensis TaxID=208199 RepID=UPI001F104004|nr:SRPBCC domain-containing protein [Pseudalkalibacillus hwajinpoensis]